MEEFEVIGGFRVIDQIGDGGHSDILRVQDISGQIGNTGDIYAMKRLKGRRSAERQKKRYIREFEIIKELHEPEPYPGVVRVYKYGVDKDLPYIIMQYVPSGNLQEKHEDEDPSIEEILYYVKNISDILQYIHSHGKGVYHGDIKPENILVDEKGHLLLTDFDTAQIASEGRSTQRSFGGTESYMAPEQRLRGELKIVTPQSDQYALGVMVYRWLCDRAPVDENEQYISFKRNDCMDIPLKCIALMKVERVLRKALAKEYKERYETIDAFAAALEDAVNSSYSEYAQLPALLQCYKEVLSQVNEALERRIETIMDSILPNTTLPQQVFFMGLRLQIVSLVSGFIGMLFPLIWPNFSVIPGFLIASLALSLLCVNSAGGSYKYGYLYMFATIIPGGMVACILFITYEKFLTSIAEFLVTQSSQLVPFLMLVLWLIVASIVPPLLAVGGFISALLFRIRRHKR